MKIEFTIFKSDADKYTVKAKTSLTNGSVKPDKKDLDINEVCDFFREMITELDEKVYLKKLELNNKGQICLLFQKEQKNE